MFGLGHLPELLIGLRLHRQLLDSGVLLQLLRQVQLLELAPV
jgi:hypothetical protein